MKYTLAISSIVLTIGVITLPVVWSDSDYNWNDIENYRQKSKGVAIIKHPLYQEECGSCHMAYPPGLLPATSWTKILSGLEDHYGDNAELDNDSYRSINKFLQKNSADKSNYRLSVKFNRSIKSNDIPMHISDIPYFKHEHHEIPDRMVSGNPQVKRISQCNTCHAKAEQGLFNEDDVHIPNYGQWDD